MVDLEPTGLADTVSGKVLPGTLRNALLIVGVRLIDLPSRYGFHLLIAATLGVVQTGQFYIVFSTMVALAGFGRLGIDRALTQQIAMDMASQRYGAVRPAIRRACFFVLCASSAVALLLVLGAMPFADYVLNKPGLAGPLALGALAIIPQNLGTFLAGALAGLQRVGYSQMIYSWLWPALFCATTLLLDINVILALLLIAASFTLTAVIGAFLLMRFLRAVPQAAPIPAPAGMLWRGLSMFSLEVTQLLITSLPAITLGIVSTSEETGLFALAWRIALVINLLISGVASWASPRFAQLYALGERLLISRVASQAITVVLGLSVLPVIAMLVMPVALLDTFGHGYARGALTLRILALGQFGAACFTALPEMLGMTSQGRVLRRVNFVSLVVLIAGLAILTPIWGSPGSAVAVSLALMTNGLGATVMAARHLGVTPHAELVRLILDLFKPRPIPPGGTA